MKRSNSIKNVTCYKFMQGTFLKNQQKKLEIFNLQIKQNINTQQ